MSSSLRAMLLTSTGELWNRPLRKRCNTSGRTTQLRKLNVGFRTNRANQVLASTFPISRLPGMLNLICQFSQ
jgi:hypothetical protein